MKEKLKGIYIYIGIGAGFLLLSAALLTAARFSEPFAEWYAGGPYQILAASWGRIYGILPFSAAEFLLYAFVSGGIVWILYIAVSAAATCLKIGKLKKEKIYFAKQGAVALCISGCLLFSYTIGCGINYQRISFAEQNGLVLESYTAEELAYVCALLTEELNQSAELVVRDDGYVMVHEDNLEAGAVQAMEQAAEQYSLLEGYYPKPKAVKVPWILSVQQITGIYSPFTFEANYNGDIPDYGVPFTACHELAHLRGFMREEEANFIAWLACRESDRIDFRYGGNLRGWISCMNVLYRTDYDAWMAIRVQLHPLIEADLAANREYWAKYEGPVAEAAEKVNNNYLKANGQSDGVKSYGRMADLIVAYYI